MDSAAAHEPSQAFLGLRKGIFALEPAEIGIARHPKYTVWGFLMEMGTPQSVVSLVGLGDGTISLYVSTGGGMTGIGEHARPLNILKHLLKMAPDYLPHTEPATDHPLPDPNRVRFYFLTFNGVRTAQGGEDDLGSGEHPLFPVFEKAHELIAAARQIDEGKPA